MAEYAKELAAFLNASHSNFHAVENFKKALEGAGYAPLTPGDGMEAPARGKILYHEKSAPPSWPSGCRRGRPGAFS